MPSPETRRPERAVRIRVPASTANLGPAFDAVGLALQMFLTVEVHRVASPPSRLEFRGRDAAAVPQDASNLIWRTMESVAARRGGTLPPFLLRVDNEIPLTRGLGSSATARLAAAAAADFLCDFHLGPAELLEIATAEEGHPDNVAPALVGGLVVSVSSTPILWTRMELPAEWRIVAVVPEYELETRRARAVLPESVPHRDAVYNVQRAAFLIAQLARGHRDGVREAMRDRLHQPYRAPLVPGLDEILALDCDGLIGVALSGAGPSVVALADERAEEIGGSIEALFAKHGVRSETRVLQADNGGLVRTPIGVVS